MLNISDTIKFLNKTNFVNRQYYYLNANLCYDYLSSNKNNTYNIIIDENKGKNNSIVLMNKNDRQTLSIIY